MLFCIVPSKKKKSVLFKLLCALITQGIFLTWCILHQCARQLSVGRYTQSVLHQLSGLHCGQMYTECYLGLMHFASVFSSTLWMNVPGRFPWLDVFYTSFEVNMRWANVTRLFFVSLVFDLIIVQVSILREDVYTGFFLNLMYLQTGSVYYLRNVSDREIGQKYLTWCV